MSRLSALSPMALSPTRRVSWSVLVRGFLGGFFLPDEDSSPRFDLPRKASRAINDVEGPPFGLHVNSSDILAHDSKDDQLDTAEKAHHEDN